MACISCTQSRNEGAQYCRNCGDNLITGENPKQTIKLLLILTAMEILVGLIWFVVNRFVIPLVLKSDWTRAEPFYKILGWASDIMIIVTAIACCALTRNKNVRTVLIVYIVFRVIFAVGYRVLPN